MRLISQDREINIPYDLFSLYLEKESPVGWSIVARDVVNKYPTLLGLYSSREKCEQVFEYIWDSSSRGNSNTVILLPEDERVEL